MHIEQLLPNATAAQEKSERYDLSCKLPLVGWVEGVWGSGRKTRPAMRTTHNSMQSCRVTQFQEANMLRNAGMPEHVLVAFWQLTLSIRRPSLDTS
eukprot:6473490-Amphidinium_carterae.2